MKKKFEDYVLDESSETGFRYVGVYYRSDLTIQQRKSYGLLQIIGGILMGIYIVGAAFLTSIGNKTPFIVFPMEFILICIGYYVSGAYHLYKSEERMEKRTYEKAFVFTVQATMVASLLSFISLAGELIVLMKNWNQLTGYTEYVFFTMLLFLFAGCLATWKWHRHLYELAKKET